MEVGRACFHHGAAGTKGGKETGDEVALIVAAAADCLPPPVLFHLYQAAARQRAAERPLLYLRKKAVRPLPSGGGEGNGDRVDMCLTSSAGRLLQKMAAARRAGGRRQ